MQILLKTSLLLVFSIFLSEAIAQSDSLLVGRVDRADLQTGDFGSIFLNEYQFYNPDQGDLVDIGSDIFNLDITVILATWCHDSQLQVPRFFKILDLLNYNTSNIQIYSVDKDKMCGEIDLSKFDFQFVPTFIFFRDGKEIGRIVESPQYTLEKDIFLMLFD